MTTGPDLAGLVNLVDVLQLDDGFHVAMVGSITARHAAHETVDARRGADLGAG